jgi:hypothetical protein
MSETPTIEELEQYVTRLQAGSAIIYSLLNDVNTLHAEDDGQCLECDQAYPCNTMAVLLETMVEENPAD